MVQNKTVHKQNRQNRTKMMNFKIKLQKTNLNKNKIME